MDKIANTNFENFKIMYLHQNNYFTPNELLHAFLDLTILKFSYF